jgi:hypothetical protein
LYTQNFSRLICIDAGEAAGAGKGGIFLAFFNKKYFKIKHQIFSGSIILHHYSLLMITY